VPFSRESFVAVEAKAELEDATLVGIEATRQNVRLVPDSVDDETVEYTDEDCSAERKGCEDGGKHDCDDFLVETKVKDVVLELKNGLEVGNTCLERKACKVNQTSCVADNVKGITLNKLT
jgi:hypothetical protein